MLSGLLSRKRKIDQALREPTTAYIVKSLKPAPQPGTTPVSRKFTASDTVTINGTNAIVQLPQQSKILCGLVDIWQTGTQDFSNDEQGFQTFITAVGQAGVDLDNLIDQCDSNVSNIQTFSSLFVIVIQGLQTILAAAQISSGETTDYQTVLSTVLAGTSLILAYISSNITNKKTAAINNRTTISTLETAQVNGQTTTTSVPEAKPAAEAEPVADAPGPFVSSTNLTINGTKIDVNLPVKSSSCFKSWNLSLKTYNDTVTDFQNMIKDLVDTEVALTNRAQSCENQITSIENFTALGSALVGVMQTGVTGAANLSSTSLQIFQVIVSVGNALFAGVAKAVSSTITMDRNQVLEYSSDVADLRLAQTRPK